MTYTRSLIWKSLLICAVFASSAAAQIGPGPFAYFPTKDTTDSRMLSFGCTGVRTLEEGVSISLAAPPSEASFTLSIFDGDTGSSDALGRRHWDLGSRQLIFELYFDPLKEGNVEPANLAGRWGGNDANMPDNDWFDIEISIDPRAAAPSGNSFYHLVIFVDPSDDGGCQPGEQLTTDFKLAASAPMTFLMSQFAFEASLRSIFDDGEIVYPEWDGAYPPATSDFFLTTPTTYDGTFEFFLNVPERSSELVIFDGDFDHGRSSPGVGIPSGVAIPQCDDLDDADTPDDYLGLLVNLDISEALPEGINSPGAPEDDTPIDLGRRGENPGNVGCVRYSVTDPNGVVYRNDNPSGNMEWEQFRIAAQTALNPNDSDYVVDEPLLPGGIWKVEATGLDMNNLNFWIMDSVCGEREGEPACPGSPYLLGDTVFLDSNGNGTQDAGEPGIPGVEVQLLRRAGGEPVMTRVTGDSEMPDFAACQAKNTGRDEQGLYCFGVDDPAEFTVVIAPESFLPGGPLAGLVSTTGGEEITDTLIDDILMTYDFGYRGGSSSCDQGCTPGYWKQRHHFDSWRVYCPRDKFNDIFGVQVPGNPSLLKVLRTGGGGFKALGRHAVAALLNTTNAGVTYRYSTAEVITLVQQAYADGDYQMRKNLLATQNELGCPLN